MHNSRINYKHTIKRDSIQHTTLIIILCIILYNYIQLQDAIVAKHSQYQQTTVSPAVMKIQHSHHNHTRVTFAKQQQHKCFFFLDLTSYNYYNSMSISRLWLSIEGLLCVSEQ